MARDGTSYDEEEETFDDIGGNTIEVGETAESARVELVDEPDEDGDQRLIDTDGDADLADEIELLGDGSPEAEEADEADSLSDDPADAIADEADAVQAADGDDDLKGYSAKVRARIGRERNVTQRERQAKDQAIAETAALRTKFTELGATNTMLQHTLVHEGLRAVEIEIKASKASLTKAIEEGETEKQVEEQARFNEANNRKGQLESFQKSLDPIPDGAKAPDEGGSGRVSTEPAPITPAQQTTTPAPAGGHAATWAKANPWFNDPRYAAEQAFVRAIDKEIYAAGYSPTDPSYFAELNRQVADKLPGVPLKGLNGKAAVAGQRQRNRTGGNRSPVTTSRPGAGVGEVQGANRGTKGGTMVNLTDDHRRAMRDVGLDPENKEQAAAYQVELRNERKAQGRQRRRA